MLPFLGEQDLDQPSTLLADACPPARDLSDVPSWALNGHTRLDAATIAFQLDHAMSRIVIVDREYMPLIQVALALAMVKPVVIQYDDPAFDGPATPTDAMDYEAFVAGGDPNFARLMP